MPQRTWVQSLPLRDERSCPECGRRVATAVVGPAWIVVEEHPDVSPDPEKLPTVPHRCPALEPGYLDRP